MPSPFPGMDPWLEDPEIFPDLHNRMIAYMSELLNQQLPAQYYTAIANRIYLDDDDRHFEPDANVYRNTRRKPAGRKNGLAAVLEANPVIVKMPKSEINEWYAELRTGADDRLVTSIEILSPTNKRRGSVGRRKYRRKQREMIFQGVNLVEIDLLRSGRHTTSVDEAKARRSGGEFDYHVSVYRAAKPQDYEFYPVLIAQRLPMIAIPLLPTVPDAVISLQEIFARCYEASRFGQRVEYASKPNPPLTQKQNAWANAILRKRERTKS